MMQDLSLSFSTPGLLFPAISLLFLSFTNRFISYASLVRGLHDQWRRDCDPAVSQQIKNLRRRMHLIRSMQISGSISLLLCTLSMVLLLFPSWIFPWIAFAGALIFMAVSLVQLIIEVAISMHAIELQLDDMQDPASVSGCRDEEGVTL
ncbi:MAG: DUF2721 domain-containing protein [Spirochaeta sp.]